MSSRLEEMSSPPSSSPQTSGERAVNADDGEKQAFQPTAVKRSRYRDAAVYMDSERPWIGVAQAQLQSRC